MLLHVAYAFVVLVELLEAVDLLLGLFLCNFSILLLRFVFRFIFLWFVARTRVLNFDRVKDERFEPSVGRLRTDGASLAARHAEVLLVSRLEPLDLLDAQLT